MLCWMQHSFSLIHYFVQYYFRELIRLLIIYLNVCHISLIKSEWACTYEHVRMCILHACSFVYLNFDRNPFACWSSLGVLNWSEIQQIQKNHNIHVVWFALLLLEVASLFLLFQPNSNVFHVTGITDATDKQDVQLYFSKFGKISCIHWKQRTQGYVFVEFVKEIPQDVELTLIGPHIVTSNRLVVKRKKKPQKMPDLQVGLLQGSLTYWKRRLWHCQTLDNICVRSHQNDAHVRSYILLMYSFYLCPYLCFLSRELSNDEA